jgi:AbrB family looped-hinge helix DNA binding protein
MTAKVSARGQTVIPAALRKKYDIRPHSRVEFLDVGNEIVLVPVPRDGFKAARGFLKGQGIAMPDLWDHRRRERKTEKDRESKRRLG